MSLKTEIAAELARLQEANGGVLLPTKVVEFARNPETALHRQFEWDDTEAAAKWRLEQARQVIRLHITVIGENADPVRAFVSLTTDRKGAGGYRALAAVMSDPAMADQMLRDALGELRVVQRKYKQLQALRPIWEAMEEIGRGEDSEGLQATG